MIICNIYSAGILLKKLLHFCKVINIVCRYKMFVAVSRVVISIGILLAEIACHQKADGYFFIDKKIHADLWAMRYRYRVPEILSILVCN